MIIPKREIDLSPKAAKKYDKHEKIMNELLSEADLAEKEFEEWGRENNKAIDNGSLTSAKRKELKRDLRKIKKKYTAVMSKLESLRYKNRKEIVKEVDRHGKANG